MWHTICHVETCDMWHVRYFILWHVTVLKTMDGNTGNTDYYLKLLSHQIKRFDVSITILNTLRWTIPTLSFSMDWFDCVFLYLFFTLRMKVAVCIFGSASNVKLLLAKLWTLLQKLQQLSLFHIGEAPTLDVETFDAHGRFIPFASCHKERLGTTLKLCWCVLLSFALAQLNK